MQKSFRNNIDTRKCIISRLVSKFKVASLRTNDPNPIIFITYTQYIKVMNLNVCHNKNKMCDIYQ